MPRRPKGTSGGVDRFGFDEHSEPVSAALGKLVPQPVAARALTVAIETEREVFAVGEPVSFTVTIRNRLPVPVTATTTERRLWAWTVDGLVEADEAPRQRTAGSNSFSLRSRGEIRVHREWVGRIRRTTDSGARWEHAEPGEHELGVFLTTPNRPSATTTVEIRAEQ